MAGYFKRRKSPGPSKNELKIQRGAAIARQARSLGTLGENFPEVQRILLAIDFLNPQQLLIDQKQQEYKPSNPCNFVINCSGRCSSGTFDLTAQIRQLLENRQPSAEFFGICQNPLYADTSNTCAYQFKCRATISYLPNQPERP